MKRVEREDGEGKREKKSLKENKSDEKKCEEEREEKRGTSSDHLTEGSWR